MFWAAMPAILSGWRRINRKFFLDSSLAQCRKGVFQRDGVACPEGLEPPTYSLEGYCSIQLSYGQ